MGLETTTTISGLNALWPLGSDAKAQGDDHLRLLKAVLQKQFGGGTSADLFFGVKQTPDRWAWNDKADGSGVDVMTLGETGNLAVTGTFTLTGITNTSSGVHVSDVSAGYITLDGSLSALAVDYAGPGVDNGIHIRNRNTTVDAVAVLFQYDGAAPSGSIRVLAGGAGTTYNTTSDIRLKQGLKAAENARALVDALQVVEYAPPPERTVQAVEGVTPGPDVFMGIPAQQAYGVYPLAVMPPDTMPSYKPDARVGDEGFIPWMVDYSKFVPMLLANMQEANARIDALEARIAALEGGAA